jgi:hypothetical protein
LPKKEELVNCEYENIGTQNEPIYSCTKCKNSYYYISVLGIIIEPFPNCFPKDLNIMKIIFITIIIHWLKKMKMNIILTI